MPSTSPVIPRTQIAYRFFSGNSASYDRIVKLFTLGGDRTWKRSILDKLPPQASRVLDLACGTGILTFALAQRYPQAEILGVDLMPDYLEIARGKAREAKISNVQFLLGRAEEVVLEGLFDCITGSYLPKYADPHLLLRNIAPHLRPGAPLVLHDFTHPSNRLVAWVWERYFLLLQMVGPRLFPEWRQVFRELPSFLRATTWVQELKRAMEEYGLVQVEVEYLGWGTAAIVSGVGRRSNARQDIALVAYDNQGAPSHTRAPLIYLRGLVEEMRPVPTGRDNLLLRRQPLRSISFPSMLDKSLEACYIGLRYIRVVIRHVVAVTS